MSNYNREHGEWILPSKDYLSIKKSVRSTIQSENNRIFKLLKCAHADAYTALRGKRVPDKTRVVSDALHRRLGNAGDAFSPLLIAPDRKALRVPTRKEFDALRAPVTNRTTNFLAYGERGYAVAHIQFNDRTRRVVWATENNNHAVEDAHTSVAYNALMTMINHIKWTKGTGGEITYSDEYIEGEMGCPRIRTWGPKPGDLLALSKRNLARLRPRTVSVPVSMNKELLMAIEERFSQSGGATAKNIAAFAADSMHYYLYNERG